MLMVMGMVVTVLIVMVLVHLIDCDGDNEL